MLVNIRIELYFRCVYAAMNATKLHNFNWVHSRINATKIPFNPYNNDY